jgi:hypothetical protein
MLLNNIRKFQPFNELEANPNNCHVSHFCATSPMWLVVRILPCESLALVTQ